MIVGLIVYGVHLGAGRGQAQAIGGIGRRVGGDGLSRIGLGGTRGPGSGGLSRRPVRVVVRPVRPGQQRNERLGGAAHVGAGIASLWEIAIKKSIDKLEFEHSIEKIAELCHEKDILILQIQPKYFDKIIKLPNIHNDPFDRLKIGRAHV